MAYAFEGVIGADGETTFVSEVDPEECAILIHAIDELIAILVPPAGLQPDAEAEPKSGQESSSGEQGSDSQVDQLFEELGLGDLFTSSVDGAGVEPVDPISARLFPPGYIGDQSAARDFRRFTESELRQEKIETAFYVRETLEAAAAATPPRVVLPPEEATSWLRGVNDLRLTIAVQLGIGQPDERERAAAPEAQAVRGLYDYLTWWQNSLLEAFL